MKKIKLLEQKYLIQILILGQTKMTHLQKLKLAFRFHLH